LVPAILQDDTGYLVTREMNSEMILRELDAVREEFKKIYPRIVARSEKVHKANARRINRKAKAPNFNIGEFVLVAKDKGERRGAKKLDLAWRGPFEVVGFKGDLVLKLRRLVRRENEGRRSNPTFLAHASRVIPFASSELDKTVELENVSWDGLRFRVDKITRIRAEKNGRTFRFFVTIRWEGFDRAHDTDEPLDLIYDQIPDLIEAFAKKDKRMSAAQRRAFRQQVAKLKGNKRPNERTNNRTNEQLQSNVTNVVSEYEYGSSLRDAVREQISVDEEEPATVQVTPRNERTESTPSEATKERTDGVE